MRPSNLLRACLMLCVPAVGNAGGPTTLTVDTTSDTSLTACLDAVPADCSLRGALNRLGGVSVPHNVHFNIPASDTGCIDGVCTIRPVTVYDFVAQGTTPEGVGIPIVIDGYTQPGSVVNTLGPDEGGTNAQLKIVLTGTSCGGTDGCRSGLFLLRGGTVRGLVINGFRNGSSNGTALQPDNSGSVVEGCFLGTDVTGMVAVPNDRGVVFGGNPFGGALSSNGRIGGTSPHQRNLISGNQTGRGGGGEGVILDGANHVMLGNLIGTNAAGTAALPNNVGILLGGGVNFFQVVGNASAAGRNVISGNLTAGIDILGAGGSGQGTNGTRIIGNFIGTDVSGTMPVGNGGFGIQIRASANGTPLVGGPAAGEGNVIAFNGTEGVATQNVGGYLSGNRIFANGRSGISSTASPRHPNDAGDPDSSSNKGQNFPDISAFATNGASVDLSYRVDSTTANSAYPLRIEFFKADGDEGRDFLGADSYASAEAQTTKPITLSVPVGVTLTANDVILATATDADGNTSEFSFLPATLAIQTPAASSCTSADSVFCNGFESGPQQSLLVGVIVAATSGPFNPNGVVDISDDRGASCTAILSPSATSLTSSGSCILVNSGAPGAIAITATLSTFRSAFGSETGGHVTTTTNFTVE